MMRSALASASRSWITVIGFILGLDAVGYVQTAGTLVSHWKPFVALLIAAAVKGAVQGAWEALKAAFATKDKY